METVHRYLPEIPFVPLNGPLGVNLNICLEIICAHNVALKTLIRVIYTTD